MLSKFNRLINLLGTKFQLILSISLGVFLFVIFFQPFPAEKFDFSNQLIFDAGIGAIIFLLMFLLRIIFSFALSENDQNVEKNILSSYMESPLIVALCSVAIAFYLRYVGSVSISFHIVIKIILICLAASVIMIINDRYKELTRQNASLINERKLIQNQIEKYEEENLNKSIEFISESGTENLVLPVAEVVFIQSADNYVEIAYREDNRVRKKLIRNTLKNAELQIKKYSNFIRCHRTCIVNRHYIEKLNRDYSSHWLTIKGYEEKIPVSRQYLLKLKEAL